jgi:hypothetical protein
LGIVGEKAAIYDPEVFSFVAIKEDSPEAWAELTELVPANVPKFIQYKPPMNNKNWTILHTATGDQMILNKPTTVKENVFETLSVDDIPQMLERAPSRCPSGWGVVSPSCIVCACPWFLPWYRIGSCFCLTINHL